MKGIVEGLVILERFKGYWLLLLLLFVEVISDIEDTLDGVFIFMADAMPADTPL